MKAGTLFTLFAILLALVTFIFSGVVKLADPGRFLLDLQAFGFIPYPAAFAIAFLLPWLEIIPALALLIRSYRAAGALILAALTSGFIAVISYAEWSGLDVDCGCFGEWFVFPNVATHLAFNTVLLISLIGLFAGARRGYRG